MATKAIAELDIVQWKSMVKKMLVTGWQSSDDFLEWVAECALHSFENGDVDDEVMELLQRNEVSECGLLNLAASVVNPANDH